MGDLQQFGASGGSLVEIVLIPSVTAPEGNSFTITDFKVTGGGASANSRFRVQVSNDNFGVSVVEVDRMELTPRGMAQSSYFSAIRLREGQSVRVLGVQEVAGPMSAQLLGKTTAENIKNI